MGLSLWRGLSRPWHSRRLGPALLANTEAMSAHPAGITRAVAPRARATLVLDGTGWQAAQGSVILQNLPLLTLPP